jgi:hypothetical protein
MAPARAPLGFVVVVAVLAGALGPRATAPSDKRADAPFEYVPPDGFVLQPKGTTEAILGAEGVEKVWIYPNLAGFTPNVTISTSAKTGVTDMAELDALVRGMPSTFSSAGIAWSEVRHELRSRPDGARVAVITGDCERGTLKYRMMQLAFPRDTGTTIATASFPREAADRWERAFEDSVTAARGVAVRHPSPPLWHHLAWGGAAAVLAFLAAAIGGRGKGRGGAARAQGEGDEKTSGDDDAANDAGGTEKHDA